MYFDSREKRSQALRGRNLIRDISVDVRQSSVIETDIEIQTENLSYKTRRFAWSAWISQTKQPTDSAEEPLGNGIGKKMLSIRRYSRTYALRCSGLVYG